MNIFLAGIIQGSKVAAEIHSQDWRTGVRELLGRHLPDAQVYCHYSEHPNSITYDLPDIRRTFDAGLRRARDCDVLVAFLPSASMGTAIEIYEAARGGAAVLLITPMAANWVVRYYGDRIFPDLAAFERFLAGGELADLVAEKRGRN